MNMKSYKLLTDSKQLIEIAHLCFIKGENILPRNESHQLNTKGLLKGGAKISLNSRGLGFSSIAPLITALWIINTVKQVKPIDITITKLCNFESVKNANGIGTTTR